MNKEFKFFVDGTKFQTENQFITGLEIKSMANVPDDMNLYLVVPGYQDELMQGPNLASFLVYFTTLYFICLFCLSETSVILLQRYKKIPEYKKRNRE